MRNSAAQTEEAQHMDAPESGYIFTCGFQFFLSSYFAGEMNTIVVEVLIALISVVSSTDKNLTRQHVGSDVIITRVKTTPPPPKKGYFKMSVRFTFNVSIFLPPLM